MRVRAMAAIALLAAGAILAGCTGTSGVNTQDLTTATGSSTISESSSSTVDPSSSAQILTSTSTPPTDAATSVSAGTEGLSAQEAADRAAIEAQWNKFWQIYAALPHTLRVTARPWPPKSPSTQHSPTFSPTRTRLNSKGWDTYGQFTSRITWPQPVDGKATAVIADCQDASQAGSLETSTGNKTTVGVARNPLQGTFVRGQDGVWRVDQVFYLKDEPC